MAQLNRGGLTTVVNNTIYTNPNRLIKGNTARDRYLDIIESTLNILSDLNVNNGYLGIDNNGIVDVSFIKKTTPTGQVLSDSGTWIDNGAQGLASVLSLGNHTNNLDIVSLSGDSTLSVIDGLTKLAYSALGNTGAFQSNDNGSVMDWSNGSIVAAITQSEVDTTYAHNVKNTFVSPLNKFGSTLTINESDNTLYFNNGVSFLFGDQTDGQCFVQGISDIGGSRQFQIDTQYNFSGTFSNSNLILQNDAVTAQLILSSNWNDGINYRVSAIDVNAFGEFIGIDAKTINLGGTSDVINIGNVGSTVNIFASTHYEYVANQYVEDKLITLNYNGATGSAVGSGFEVEENNIITGHIKTNATRDAWSIKAPAIAFKTDLKLDLLTADRVHTLKDRTSTLADDIDLALKVDKTGWIDVSSTVTVIGFSGTPTISVWYKITDGMAQIIYNLSGTSDTNNLIVAGMPFTVSANQPQNYTSVRVTNNGTPQTTPGRVRMDAGLSQFIIQRDMAGATFIVGGTKASDGQFEVML